ncbi:MAG TPA: methylated-DNA--[protein]-cysteine S-methyltransferase [Burkholderiaceae bacterium]|nr:methylated-DNA--[protein]-cysteine S-methyltransferase [Burkholderiaceae bacterium]
MLHRPLSPQAIDAVVALLAGDTSQQVLDVPVDFEGIPEFHRRVYAAARAVPPGRTCTYGELAAQLGEPATAHAVGQALGGNPIAIIVHCHRVLRTKLRLLQIEGAFAGGDQAAWDQLALPI